jgi:hypothetical protein
MRLQYPSIKIKKHEDNEFVHTILLVSAVLRAPNLGLLTSHCGGGSLPVSEWAFSKLQLIC